MAYEEIGGNGGGSGEYEDRERVNLKIGVTLEGTFRRMSQRMPSRYGGEYRYVDFDSTDGRKMTFGASKITLERFENAELADGDRFKLVVESAKSKESGNTYARPRLFVDRAAGEPAAKPAPAAKPMLDEPPF